METISVISTLKEFKDRRNKNIEEQYSRFKWFNQKRKEITGKQIHSLPLPHLNKLMNEGISSFYLGAFFPAILSFAALIEIILKVETDLSKLNRNEKGNFECVINEAENQNIISSETAERIQYFRKNVRNKILHSTEKDVIFMAGWEKEIGTTAHMLTDEKLGVYSRLIREMNKCCEKTRENDELSSLQMQKEEKSASKGRNLLFSGEVVALDGIEIILTIQKGYLGKK